MKVLGDTLIAKRNVECTVAFVLQTSKKEPYILWEGWSNPHIVMTITSSRYTQDKRYIKSWWLPVSNLPLFQVTTIDTDTQPTSEGRPSYDAAGYKGKQVIKTVHDGLTRYWHAVDVDAVPTWVEYIPPRFVIAFTSEQAAEWVENSYKWDLSIVAGTLSELEVGPPLTDIIIVEALITDGKISVTSDSVGGIR